MVWSSAEFSTFDKSASSILEKLGYLKLVFLILITVGDDQPTNADIVAIKL